MTMIKEILDQFDALYRYHPVNVEGIDIGDYHFDEAHMDSSEYIMEFTSKSNPEVWLRINDDRVAIILIKKISTEEVEVSIWRYGQSHTKKFPLDKHWKPFKKEERKEFVTRQKYKKSK